MQESSPDIFRAIIQADIDSQNHFSDHGSALAQAYNHLIMPLAKPNDKRTQVIWGIQDFEYRFRRKPEGMWLPEKLEIMKTIQEVVQNMEQLGLDIDLRDAQNIYFFSGKQHLNQMRQALENGDEFAENWIDEFKNLGYVLRLRIA